MNATKEAEKIHNFKELKIYKKSHPESFIIAAHPYFPGLNMINDLIGKNIDCFDGVEFSWWHSALLDFNKKGEQLAIKNDIPFIGTSDTHNLKYFGITYCEIDTTILSIENIFEALRENKFKNSSKTLKTWQMFLMPFIAIRDKLWLTKETCKKFARTKLKR